jgi:hypothetical protein
MLGISFFFFDLFSYFNDYSVLHLLDIYQDSSGYTTEDLIITENREGFLTYVRFFVDLSNFNILMGHGLDFTSMFRDFTFGRLHGFGDTIIDQATKAAALQAFIDLGGLESNFGSQKPITDDLKLGPVLTEMANRGLLTLPNNTRITNICRIYGPFTR